MHKRLNTLIVCLAAIVALFALAAVPALAHHKDGHEQNSETTDENFQEADGASSEESTTEESSTSSSSEGSSFTRNTQRDPEPDPEPSQAPPSTTGPGTCEDYSGSEGGPYDHDSCDGSQGQHGGGGNGKCAGCTGKADDKGPGGQAPGDHNNGYECDHNGGVGKGNPAHARCPKNPPPPPPSTCPAGTSCLPPPPKCPPGSKECPPQVREDNVCPEGTTFAGLDVENCVLGTRFTRSGPNPNPPGSEPLGAILPRTGGSGISSILAIGVLLIAAGTSALRRRKTA